MSKNKIEDNNLKLKMSKEQIENRKLLKILALRKIVYRPRRVKTY